MSAPIMLRNQYTHLFGTAQLPVLQELVAQELELHVSLRERLFKIVNHDRDIWQSSELEGMGLFPVVAEGAAYTSDRMYQALSKTLTVLKYGSETSITREMLTDGKFDVIAKSIKELARSAKETQEVLAMNIFNNGFGTETTPDGLSVFNTAHTLPRGGTFRNAPSANVDLDVSSLDAAIADFKTQFVDDGGKILNVKPKYLLVPPSQVNFARELLGSTLKANTADNNMNSFLSYGIEVVESPHLTDTDAWFLTASPEQTGLRIIVREPIRTEASGGDLGFHTDSFFYKASFREVLGVIHARGIWGSSGA